MVIVFLSVPAGPLTTCPESHVPQREPQVLLWQDSLSGALCSEDRRAELSTALSSHRQPLSHASSAPLLWGWSAQKRMDI